MVEKESIVYLYGFSTTSESKMINLIKIVEQQLDHKHEIRVVFIHDGVIGTSVNQKIKPIMKKLLNLPITTYSLLPDLKARGIDAINLQNNVKGIDYGGLVDILVNSSKIVSWM